MATCIHEPCTCEAPSDASFCSDACRTEAGGETCHCDHEDCGGT